MNTLLLAILAGAAYIVAYLTYGRFIASKIFKINPNNKVPSQTLEDGIDYVPTNKMILFGHHFTSIAGLGPIVGPALGIIWGWVPAVIWILFGSIFMGAIHDFGALIVSMRSEGRTIGDLAGDLVNKRVKTLFLLIIFFALWIIVAIFAMIIASLFMKYNTSVFPVWSQIPIAIALGYAVYKRNVSPVFAGIIAVLLMYATIAIGSYMPCSLEGIVGESNVLATWIVILLVYVFIASILPVQILLQPRDYINSYQLIIAMGLLVLGTVVARPDIVAPSYIENPEGAPPMLPSIFVIIACGAVSGFHSLVASGTSSKQCINEADAKFIGYGSMLLEGALAILVIIAIAGGIGMGTEGDNGHITGIEAFSHHYRDWDSARGLSAKLGVFVQGGSNIVAELGIPIQILSTLFAVFLVSFAATTLDSATRIHRYVISELGSGIGIKSVKNKYLATAVAVGMAFLLAFCNDNGRGALNLWPLFGTINQLLAALTLLIVTIYLAKRGTRTIFTLIPMLFMGIITAWSMTLKIQTFIKEDDYLLLCIGLIISALEVWMVIECLLLIFQRKDSKNQ